MQTPAQFFANAWNWLIGWINGEYLSQTQIGQILVAGSLLFLLLGGATIARWIWRRPTLKTAIFVVIVVPVGLILLLLGSALRQS
jgi:hypothetical protein